MSLGFLFLITSALASLELTLKKKDLLISDNCMSSKHPCLVETFDCSPEFYSTSSSLLVSIKELLTIITQKTSSESRSFKVFPGFLSGILIPKTSSYFNHNESPDLAMFREKQTLWSTWCTAFPIPNQYFQIGSSIPFQYEKMIISGRYNIYDWISSFSISYTLDGINWIPYQNFTIFQGNTEGKEPVQLIFDPFIARAVKILPQTWNINPTTNLGGRFEFFVSRPVYENVLSNQSIIAAVAAGFKLTASSVYQHGYSVYRAGYDTQNYTIGSGSWCGSVYDKKQWIMVSSVKLVKWVKIGTMGDFQANQWVTSYNIMYTVDGINWIDYKNSYVFTGNNDTTTPVEYDLEPFIAHSIRLRPLTWVWNMCTRVEFYCVEI